MGNELAPYIAQFLSNRPYHALFLLVYPELPRLHAAVAQLRRQYEWPTLSLSAKLSQVLHDLPPQQRPSHIPRLFADLLHADTPGPLFCADIALLFEPEWRIDPLRLFLEASKSVALIVPWPGTYQNDTLTYAVPAHAHYRIWPAANLVGQAFQLAHTDRLESLSYRK